MIDRSTTLIGIAICRVEAIQHEVDVMMSNMQKLQTPNLRAVDKLDSVEERLRQTETQFEDTRHRARKAKMDFEKIKRSRYDRFMNCFNIVVDHIDGIYKSLARNPGAQVCLLVLGGLDVGDICIGTISDLDCNYDNQG